MWLLVFPLALLLAGCSFGLVGYGFGSVADGLSGLKERRTAVLRGLAALAAAGAVAVYAWGLLSLFGTLVAAEDGGADSAPVRPCRTAGWMEQHRAGIEIVGHRASFVPLGFVCETSDGGSYDNGDVPGYVNPAVASLALAALACAVAAGYSAELRARAEARAGEAGSGG
ncbi:hypothetical protein [Streptomyces sp. P9-A2]|uniref:hypothetical protein n=1 Tax=Streptomyces sp. P9-A2 TaxID=3072284 RepID=UPI002FC99735